MTLKGSDILSDPFCFMTQWSNTGTSSTTWTGASTIPLTGVPYDSLYLYDSVLTYDAAEIAYDTLWVTPGASSTVWT